MYNIEVYNKDGNMILHQEYDEFVFSADDGGYIFFRKKIKEEGGHIHKSVRYDLPDIRGFTVNIDEK